MMNTAETGGNRRRAAAVLLSALFCLLLSSASLAASKPSVAAQGAALYNAYYNLCDKLYITKMDADLGADTFIVNIDEDPDYKVTSESEVHSENGIDYKFCVYTKV